MCCGGNIIAKSGSWWCRGCDLFEDYTGLVQSLEGVPGVEYRRDE